MAGIFSFTEIIIIEPIKKIDYRYIFGWVLIMIFGITIDYDNRYCELGSVRELNSALLISRMPTYSIQVSRGMSF